MLDSTTTIDREKGVVDQSMIKRQNAYTTLTKLSPTMVFKQFAGIMLSPYKPLHATSGMSTPEPATLAQSLSYVWSHLAILLGFTAVTFTASYVIFMRQDIR